MKKVLVIENNRLVKEVLMEYLRFFGYEGELATSTVKSFIDYKFIIADYTTIKELNLLEEIASIISHKPVIILSTLNCPEEEILKNNALCLTKPFYIHEFKEALKIVDEEFHKEAQ
ncbi:response regulator [Thermodesulfovibrio sp. 3907-1M]|uniref:Response regulator n=1 Tax=Thermodesulfovibrio autotrophicus TaxID=3118333 RepID=A0AAU8GVA5_9BACT